MNHTWFYCPSFLCQAFQLFKKLRYFIRTTHEINDSFHPFDRLMRWRNTNMFNQIFIGSTIAERKEDIQNVNNQPVFLGSLGRLLIIHLETYLLHLVHTYSLWSSICFLRNAFLTKVFPHIVQRFFLPPREFRLRFCPFLFRDSLSSSWKIFNVWRFKTMLCPASRW